MSRPGTGWQPATGRDLALALAAIGLLLGVCYVALAVAG